MTSDDNNTQEQERLVLEAQIGTANYFKKYMISTSPFITEILQPYIEEREEVLARLEKEEQL